MPEKKYSTQSSAEKTQQLIKWLEDNKARDIQVFTLSASQSIADAVIIASASSMRHARGIADALSLQCRENNFEILAKEGYQAGLWILMDLNDIIIHIFQDDVRKTYNLESLLDREKIKEARQTTEKSDENNEEDK